jgi:hypothetical protein
MSGLTRIIPVYENIECAITKLQEVAIWRLWIKFMSSF